MAAISGLLVVVTGCGTPAATPAASATPAATAPSPAATAATPTATLVPPPPTHVPTPVATLPAYACGEALRVPGSVPRAQIADVEVVNEGGVGRITFTFLPEGPVAAVPDVEVRPASPPFARDPSGLPLGVPGTRFVSVVLHGGTALDEDFQPTFDGPFDIDADGQPIVALRRAGDFEAVSSYVVGLEGSTPCVRILPADGRSRLVIEIVME